VRAERATVVRTRRVRLAGLAEAVTARRVRVRIGSIERERAWAADLVLRGTADETGKQNRKRCNKRAHGRAPGEITRDRQRPARSRTGSRMKGVLLMPSATLRVLPRRAPSLRGTRGRRACLRLRLRQQRRDFLRRELAPAPDRKLSKLDVHDAH